MSLPNLPEFAEIGRQLEETGTRVKTLAGSPAVTEGNLISKTLNDIINRLGSIEKTVNDMQGFLDAQHTQNIRIAAANWNTQAKEDGRTHGYYSTWWVSRNFNTNEPIRGFPASRNEVNSLSDAQLAAILTELGINAISTYDGKLAQFRAAVGM